MASIAVERKIYIDYRVAEQQAKATIKNNPILALVELITNSDDSYRRMQNKGYVSNGKIIIELTRKFHDSIIKVIDYAEGFDEGKMDERVGGYGGDTSEFTEKDAGRGYWGRGLKEAMINLRYGSVESIKDGLYHKCELEKLDYTRNKPLKASRTIRKNLGIEANGTVITLIAKNPDVRIPQFETLKHSLEFYYSLRDIMSSPTRDVILIEKDPRGKIKREEKLSYIFPKGELYVRKSIPVPGYHKALVELELYRSLEPLSGYDDEGPLRENGLLIKSKGAVLDITLTRKFEGNIYASKIYGHATCDYIDHLLRVDKEPIVRADRAGLDWTHPFSKSVESILSKEILNFVQDEEKKVREDQQRLENEKTRKRYESSLPELNKIAKEELGELGGEGEGKDSGKLIKLPPNGFDFMPDYVQIIIDKDSILTLKALVPKVIPSGSIVTLTSDTKEIVLKDKTIILDEKDADPNNGMIISHIKVIGRQVGVEGIITAVVNDIKTEILVKVISRRKPSEPSDPKKSGLFKNFDFSPTADPHQRVKYDRSSGKIIIATKAPSVEMYFGPNGEGQDESHCQVMLSELVVEAVCREIARRKIIEGKEPYLGEASEAVNVVHNRLINKYAIKIHNLLVDRKYHRIQLNINF